MTEDAVEFGGFRKVNLSALEGRFPELADLLRKTDPLPLEVVETVSGLPTARVGGLLLHSGRDPGEEGRRTARAQAATGADTLVFLGLGLGYAAQAALDLLPGSRLVIAEADPALLTACLDVRDLRPLLSNERVSILAGGEPEGLLWAFERLGSRNVRAVSIKAQAEIYSEWYARAQSVLSRFEAKEAINGNTLRRFGRLWVRNLARNLEEIPRRPGVAELRGGFEGLPGLVAAAGPSLDEVLPRLRELRERAVLVCVDTALRSLLREGVEPDFLVVVDPQYWNARHLDRCPSPSSILVTEGAVWPSVLRQRFSAVRLCSSLFPLGAYIEQRSGAPKGRLGAGGSVATTAWDFARVLGCRPVFMAGLDLAFPGGRTHVRAGRFEQRALSAGRRLRPPATEAFRAYVGAQPRDARANDGTTVRTDQRLSLYSWWFESRMLRHPECPTRNLSAAGLAVEGMPLVSLKSVLDLPPCRDRIDLLLDGIRAGGRGRGAEDGVSEVGDKAAGNNTAGDTEDGRRGEGPTSNARGDLLDLLAGMEARARAALELTGRARDLARRGEDPAPVLALLDDADRDLVGNAAKEITGFLFPALETMLGGPAKSFEEALDRSEIVYREIRDSSAFHREILSRGA